MFCPKCGTASAEESKICEKCGYNFEEDLSVSVENESTPNQPESAKPAVASEVIGSIVEKTSKAPAKSVKTVILCIFAFVVLILFFMAASKVSSAGLDISKIKSVGGKTLEEAYYRELGQIYTGFAAALRGMGVFFASILAYLGIKK